MSRFDEPDYYTVYHKDEGKLSFDRAFRTNDGGWLKCWIETPWGKIEELYPREEIEKVRGEYLLDQNEAGEPAELNPIPEVADE